MILADTSAWVEYDRASASPADRRVAELIAGDGPSAVTEPVVTEVASVAQGHEATLPAHDADLSRVAGVIGVEMDAGSRVAEG